MFNKIMFLMMMMMMMMWWWWYIYDMYQAQFYVLSYINSLKPKKKSLKDKHYYLRFTDKETEHREVNSLAHCHKAGKWQSLPNWVSETLSSTLSIGT